MTEYKVKSTDTRKFSLTLNDIVLGDLTYQKWFALKSEIVLADNSKYQVEPKGFWRTTIELKKDENILLNFEMHWNGNIIIHTKFGNTDSHYIFKHQGVLKSKYILLNSEEEEFLVLQPDFKWNKLNYEYTIVITDEFDKCKNKDILLFTVIHCANYYMTMTTA